MFQVTLKCVYIIYLKYKPWYCKLSSCCRKLKKFDFTKLWEHMIGKGLRGFTQVSSMTYAMWCNSSHKYVILKQDEKTYENIKYEWKGPTTSQ